MSKKLKYKIISCSSQEPQYPSSQLLFGGQNGGWQTRRFCTYPQEVTFQFYGPVKLQRIEIISDNRKIPSQVDILYYLPFQSVINRQSEQRFLKYGYLNFNRNQNSQLRQQKSIMVDIKCLYLRFLIHKPHVSKENFFSQIGIQAITVYGSDLGSTFAPLQRMPRQFGQMAINNNYYVGQHQLMIDDDPFVAQKLTALNTQKQRAVQSQDFQTANEYKQIIDTVKKAGQQLRKLNLQKRIAIQQQDYEKANILKKSIEKHRKDLDELISFTYDDDDDGNGNNLQQNEFVQNYGMNSKTYSNNNNSNSNGFQDNEFVDPEMNDMIQKNRVFSASRGNNNVNNSRVVVGGGGGGGNSRIVINKSLLKKQLINNNSQRQKQNYDDRLLPTHSGVNKQKSRQQQLAQLENPSSPNNNNKKLQLKLQQVDGKYIQYSIQIAEHFNEDTAKKFFSQHWQFKVQALGVILVETKKKQVADVGLVKCLLIVVKNSIAETNFQVSLNSLQVLQDMLKINAKGNLLARNNQVNNDLDIVSKEIVKKISDNNNKIKQQAEKALNEMVGSSLYGPEACALMLTKTKDKVKLSAKQLLSRICQVKKIIEKTPNNQQIIALGSEFAMDNVKNPAVQVRNQAMALLLKCRDSDSSGIVQKKIEDRNLSQTIQAYESKAGQKQPKAKKAK